MVRGPEHCSFIIFPSPPFSHLSRAYLVFCADHRGPGADPRRNPGKSAKGIADRTIADQGSFELDSLIVAPAVRTITGPEQAALRRWNAD